VVGAGSQLAALSRERRPPTEEEARGDDAVVLEQVAGGFAFRAGKNDYRGILTGLEGITGKKAIDTAPMNVKN